MLLVSLMAACSSDIDGDGLRGRGETRHGTDPLNPDSDGDGLLDGDEVERGLSPLSADTDGDGYRDGDELREGSDPLDPTDGIYIGGWPYFSDKDTIRDPGFEGTALRGDTVPRVVAADQFGQEVDLYDFVGSDDIVVFELCDAWKGVCNWIGDWRCSPEDYVPSPGSWLESWSSIRRAMNRDEMWTITILVESYEGVPAASEDVVDWAMQYPHPRNLVIRDEEGRLFAWANQHRAQAFTPMWWTVNDEMRILNIDSDDDPTAYWTMYSLAQSLE